MNGPQPTTSEPQPGPQGVVDRFPPRFRLLWIGADEPTWVGLTLKLDAAGCHDPQFRWVSTGSEALTLLRDESFDSVLIADDRRRGAVDAVSLLRALRGSGCDDPVLVLAAEIEESRWAEACRLEADVLVTNRAWESPALLPTIARAMARVELVRENQRLSLADQRRLVRERDEADHLLNQQRQIIQELRALPTTAEKTPQSSSAALPETINEYYQELLRTYVIIGSGRLGDEIAKLAEILSVAGLSPHETLELHVERVESLVRGLGSRSTRHVMGRADLLVLELMMHLAESYQARADERVADAARGAS